MKIEYLTESAYDDLKDNMFENKEYYYKDDVWIDNYFNGKEYKIESNIEVNKIFLNTVKNEAQNENNDFINAINLFETLNVLSQNQASNPYMWTYLCHTIGWKYLRNRWEITPGNESRIKERYICTNSRLSLVRNGLSRLWWAAWISIDEKRKNKWELTKILFQNEDLFVGIMERDYSLCKNITLGILDATNEYYIANGKFPVTDVRRECLKMLNRMGAVTLLDQLSIDEVKEEVLNFYNNNK